MTRERYLRAVRFPRANYDRKRAAASKSKPAGPACTRNVPRARRMRVCVYAIPALA